uniref:Lymphoid-restricted membrane protein n=1 Tax=Cyprinodon variegatus TaxID=28743 RepID=A0A3Q2DLQ8_CYPVA
MDCCTPQPSRRHNPVDSICRKLQTIQWRGDREPNSPFQIPKLSSSSYDSPQSGLRHNLEAILKKGAFVRDEEEKLKAMGMPSSAASHSSGLGSYHPLTTPDCNRSTPANVTYTITSTLGERRGADGSDVKQFKAWQRYCSTPTGHSRDSPYFTFTRGPNSTQSECSSQRASPPQSRTFTPGNSTLSYNVNFCSADRTNSADCELAYPALVVKRLSMGEGGSSVNSENKRNMAEISLICEENLLDTIFHACDTQRRGKVYVSHIVDYLRHTTSRSSEDSGLEELCNMLDPEQKDVSIDLDTYHAVMREWIDDCRNKGTAENNSQEDLIKFKDGASARRSMLLNMTSGSLEAFGGEASRMEFETSELVYCVADLQMSNQKLQEEVRKLKQVVESMEEGNQKLAEENEDLRNQARVNQQLAQKEKMLKEEVEEMKATLSCTEEGRARASAHSKHMERENQSLITKIASLQDENFKITMENDELQKKIRELCDINTDLQVFALCPISVFCLRKDKNRLESQMQMILPDLAGMALSVAYRLNQSSLGSLQTELALAQSPLEVTDYLSTTMTSQLDETLDREVLLLLQGPNTEHVALEFKSLLNKLKRDFKDETSSTVQAELDARRADWAVGLDQLAQYTDSLEKELIKMAGNMRRSRTDILHLSVRVQEQENQKRQLSEELEQLKISQDSREASCQTPAPEEEEPELDWDEEFALQDFLKNELAERNCWVQDGKGVCSLEEKGDKLTERVDQEDGEERWTVVEQAGEGEVRDTSTPLSTVLRDPQPEQSTDAGMQIIADAPKRFVVVLFFFFFSSSLLLCLVWSFFFFFFFSSSKLYLDIFYENVHSMMYKNRLHLFQAEFQRLALGFKCDMFTLEKRLRLEERSRDLAEENVRREVSSCQGLLQALTPLCEDDSQSMEIIQRLQKNLEILNQSMTRVSSRSEMLGAIHQENRIGKAVEVMIQHVENLRRTYTKEHSELLELREALMQSERSFGSQTEKDDFRGKKQPSKYTVGGLFLLCHYVMTMVFRNVASKSMTRPPLKRFVRDGCPPLGCLTLVFIQQTLMHKDGLLALLASLVMQPAVDAAPVGTGDSWMTIQQLLWPYTGLRHNGQPPV